MATTKYLSMKDDEPTLPSNNHCKLKGAPSVLYLVDNIPSGTSKSRLVAHFQKKKRHNGGEVVEEECKFLGPKSDSALLMFENASEVSQVEAVEHFIDDQPLNLYPLVTETVTIEIKSSSFVQTLIFSKAMQNIIQAEDLQLTANDSRYLLTGNWLSIQIFRDCFKRSMVDELSRHFNTTDPGQNEEAAISYPESARTIPNNSNGGISTVVSKLSPDESATSQLDRSSEVATDQPELRENVSEDLVGSISAKGSNLNPDILALMEKTGAYQRSAVSYDQQTMTINIECDNATEKEKIKEELFTVYRELMMGGKLKEHSVSVSDVQQASAIVDEYNKTFNHTYFKYDAEKGEIKCLSNDARQMQHVKKRLTASIQMAASAQSSASLTKSVSIDLPKVSRRVTIKFGNIVHEYVDAIVNAANNHLAHIGGVAAAIDRASNGEVQKASTKLISQCKSVSTGDAVATVSGGGLKCTMVIHAVGPKAEQHGDKCGVLLKNACTSALKIAEQFEVKSISFPPISSGVFGVSKELVADAMLSTLCSYKCSNPVLLTDVRIVIIDDPTYQVFLNVFHREKQSLESLLGAEMGISKYYSDNSSAVTTIATANTPTLNLEMAANDPLSQQPTNLSSQGVNRQEKRLFNGAKGQTNFSAAVTLPNKSLPPTTKEEKKETDSCPICLESLKHLPLAAVTSCKHCKQAYCKSCLDEALKYKPYCPACTLPLRKITGNQPKGSTMNSYTTRQSLPGYKKYGTITINYFIPGGTQGPEHPNPGQRFYGTSRTAYLPDSPEGQKVYRLLRKAFDAKLVFTIGTSHTTGVSNVVVWNDIHHKTSKLGGPQSYGYPDPAYLNRVTEELATKGIKE